MIIWKIRSYNSETVTNTRYGKAPFNRRTNILSFFIGEEWIVTLYSATFDAFVKRSFVDRFG